LWQGDYKEQSGATTIVDGLAQQFPDAELVYPDYQDRTSKEQVQADQDAFIQRLKDTYGDMTAANTVMIGLLAEPVYAEFMGDIANPYCQTESKDGCLYDLALNPYLPKQQKTSLLIDYNEFGYRVIDTVRADDGRKDIPLVTVLFSGRPMIVSEPSKALSSSQAFIAAWLPGTTGGQAIANAIGGDYVFCGTGRNDDGHCVAGSPNTLPVNWVRNPEQLRDYPVYRSGTGFVGYGDPLFPINHGLGTGG
jgi:beta-glucosidase